MNFKFNTLSNSTDIEAPSNEAACFNDLSYSERMRGFIICFVLGSIIQVLSFGSIFGILTGDPTKFALSFTLGNMVSLVGTCFLAGPRSQCKSMSNRSRLVASLIFLLSMALTLISALALHKPLLVLIFSLFQLCAYIWYTASYIPFGRSIIKGCLSKCLPK